MFHLLSWPLFRKLLAPLKLLFFCTRRLLNDPVSPAKNAEVAEAAEAKALGPLWSFAGITALYVS